MWHDSFFCPSLPEICHFQICINKLFWERALLSRELIFLTNILLHLHSSLWHSRIPPAWQHDFYLLANILRHELTVQEIKTLINGFQERSGWCYKWHEGKLNPKKSQKNRSITSFWVHSLDKMSILHLFRCFFFPMQETVVLPWRGFLHICWPPAHGD